MIDPLTNAERLALLEQRCMSAALAMRMARAEVFIPDQSEEELREALRHVVEALSLVLSAGEEAADLITSADEYIKAKEGG